MTEQIVEAVSAGVLFRFADVRATKITRLGTFAQITFEGERASQIIVDLLVMSEEDYLVSAGPHLQQPLRRV